MYKCVWTIIQTVLALPVRIACCSIIAKKRATTFEIASVRIFTDGVGKLFGVAPWMFAQHDSAFMLSLQVSGLAHGLHMCKTCMSNMHFF